MQRYTASAAYLTTWHASLQIALLVFIMLNAQRSAVLCLSRRNLP